MISNNIIFLENIWKTDLDWMVPNNDRMVVLSFFTGAGTGDGLQVNCKNFIFHLLIWKQNVYMKRLTGLFRIVFQKCYPLGLCGVSSLFCSPWIYYLYLYLYLFYSHWNNQLGFNFSLQMQLFYLCSA